MIVVTLERILKRWESMREKAFRSKKNSDPLSVFKESLLASQHNLAAELEPYCRAAGINHIDIADYLTVSYDIRLDENDRDSIISDTIQTTLEKGTKWNADS